MGGKNHYGLLDEKDPNYEVGNGSDRTSRC
jgi:hypothetical protein